MFLKLKLNRMEKPKKKASVGKMVAVGACYMIPLAAIDYFAGFEMAVLAALTTILMFLTFDKKEI